MKITKSEVTITMTVDEAQELRSYLTLAIKQLYKDIDNDRITARAYKDELAVLALGQTDEWKNGMQATIDSLEEEAMELQFKLDKIIEMKANILDAIVE